MNSINRKERIKGLKGLEKDIQIVESLFEIITLYKQDIKLRLDKISSNKTVQKNILAQMGEDKSIL